MHRKALWVVTWRRVRRVRRVYRSKDYLAGWGKVRNLGRGGRGPCLPCEDSFHLTLPWGALHPT